MLPFILVTGITFSLISIILWLFIVIFTRPKTFNICDPVLLIIAHPDDESIFFAPIIQNLIYAGLKVDLLCLSTGNYDNRRCELRKAAEIMKLRHLTIINTNHFEDSPNSLWSFDQIIKTLQQTCDKYGTNSIISFDERGVSGHINHCSIGKALEINRDNKKLPNIYALKSLPTFRKYCFLIDLLASVLNKEDYVCTPISLLHIPYLSMMAHKSQLVWFRWLYIFFSTYMYKNIIIRY